MNAKGVLLFLAFGITLILLTTTSLATLVIGSSKAVGGGSVVQEKINSGDPTLDKKINRFYSCISKTHQDPPSIEKVDNCYYQALGGISSSGASTESKYGVTGPNTSTTSISPSTNHQHKHGITTTNNGVTT
jgi:hypothetical protein